MRCAAGSRWELHLDQNDVSRRQSRFAGGRTDGRTMETNDDFRLINSALRKIAVRYVCPLQMLSRFRDHAALHDRWVDVTSNQYSYTGHSRTMHMRDASFHLPIILPFPKAPSSIRHRLIAPTPNAHTYHIRSTRHPESSPVRVRSPHRC